MSNEKKPSFDGRSKGKYYKRVFVLKEVTEICCEFTYCLYPAEVIFEEGSRLRILGESTFDECICLKKISLPDGLEKIGRRCFSRTALEELVIPASVKEIGAEAFWYCHGLKSISFSKSPEKLDAKNVTNKYEQEG